MSRKKYPYFSFFNLILARYNELGLKSKKVRSRMEQRLVKHILGLFHRENIPIKSSRRSWGRLIFEFDPEYIPKALELSKFFIGVHSFSPGFTFPPDFDTVSQKAMEFAKLYLVKGDTFAVRARRIKPYPKNTQEIEREIGGKIFDMFMDKGDGLIVDLKHPMKTIYIEIRTKEAYIYAHKVPTIWGGNPIEHDKAMFAIFEGNTEDLIAAQLLIRRGTVIIPLILKSNTTSPQKLDEIYEQIQLAAKFFPEPINSMEINMKSLNEFINRLEIDTFQKQMLEAFGKMMICELLNNKLKNLDNMTIKSDKTLKFMYTNKRMIIKAVISATTMRDRIDFFIGQRFDIPHFMPLIGINANIIKELHENLLYCLQDFDLEANVKEGFSLANSVKRDIENTSGENTESIQRDPYDTEMNLEEIYQKIQPITDSSEFKEIITNIIDHQITTKKITGKITEEITE
jgi:tRNA uracil 4-sulfurtransferase